MTVGEVPDASDVARDVESAESFDRSSDHRVDRDGVGHVEIESEGATTGSSDFLGRGIGPFEIGARDSGPLGGEAERRRSADARAGSGDEDTKAASA